MEAEYIACSTACRDLLPLMNLVQEVASAVHLDNTETTNLHSTIWEEDNVGALVTLAHLELPRMTDSSLQTYCRQISFVSWTHHEQTFFRQEDCI